MRSDRMRAMLRLPITVLVTLLIIGVEFVLLMVVYDRGAPEREQRVLVAALSAAVDHSSAPEAARLVAAAAPALRNAELASSSWRPVASAASAASAATVLEQPGRLAVLRARLHGLDARVRADAAAIDGQVRWIYALLLVGVSVGWAVWFRKLVTRHRALERSVAEHQAVADGEHRLAELVRNSGDLVAVLDADTTITYATSSSLAILGIPDDVLVGTPLLDHVVPEDVERLARALSRSDQDDHTVRLRMRHADGRVLHIEGTLRDLTGDPVVSGHVLTVRDVTERVALESQLNHQALHDPLTGLANRRLFADRLGHALERRAGRPLAVLFCDLDDFKDVNDSLGHGSGDRVLTEVSRRLRSVLRTGDTIARFGGDEFAVLLEDSDAPRAEEVAARIVEVVHRPLDIDGAAIAVDMSVGLALAGGEEDGEELLRNADVAMYLAKSRGKAGYAVYESQLHEHALERLHLRAGLQRALRNEEFVLHYQPTVDLDTGDISGFEALLRWQHPERGLVPPATFIPVAEETGLIVAIGRWVLRTACRDAADLQRSGGAIRMSVNVAAAQLTQEDFTAEVREALDASGLDAGNLTVEITEGALLRDLEGVSAQLTALRAMGVRIAIDDFGTGYSSLRYLQELPVDVLKIDKSFVDRVGAESQDLALLEAIIAMSHSLRLTTVAEGVEKAAQAAWLGGARCELAQGFYWSPAVPLDEAVAMLEQESTDTAA